ncbi:DUF2254 domain-containing protein [Paenisporosarcina antarctica]|uniref:DUF2254 domain-containing protein n=1 Tax=Paenisporosarcina antarctica TaxID=417367 RepID=A0A4P7A0T6_9BACL|nr:DUF2254 domain-containing protein [Paenisporosarcina antarctica]QBP42263.1 DUF2254 domain-containing protein [Paenisporosarcina antarctica]
MDRYWLKIKESIWFIPTLYSLFSVVLAIISSTIDHLFNQTLLLYVPPVFLTSVNLAQTILGGLSAALLTMTTFTFSTIMVVLITYSSQFSPRTMKNLVRDPMVWRVLGVFMGGFIYTTLSLLFMQESITGESVISGLIGVLYAMVCLIFFAIFIHHIAQNIQVNTLIEKLKIEGIDAVGCYETFLKREDMTTQTNDNWTLRGTANPITARSDGYLQLVDIEQLVALAQKHKGKIEMNCYIGDFVQKNSPVVTLYTKDQIFLQEDDGKLFVVGRERDTRQDPVFAIQKMVEVSLRAISPGINDPNTAIHNIHQLGRLLGSYSQLPRRDFIFMDEDKYLRVKMSIHSFEDVLYHTFHQLRHYGKSDISVLCAITDSLTMAAELAPLESKKDIWTIQLYVIEGMENSDFHSLDRVFYQKKIDKLANQVGEGSVDLPIQMINENS